MSFTKFIAVIKVSGYNESCNRALSSIDRLSDHFVGVLVVSKNQGLPYDEKKYQQLDAKKVPKEQSEVKKLVAEHGPVIILRIHPQCVFDLADLEEIRLRVRKSSNTEFYFGISSNFVCNFSFLNPFLMIALLWQWLHETFDRRKIYQTTDLRAFPVTIKGSNDIVMTKCTRSWWWRLYNPVYTSKSSSNSCVVQITDIVQFLHNHRHFGVGFWVFYFLFYYISYWMFVAGFTQGLIGLPLVIMVSLLAFFINLLIINGRVKTPYILAWVALIPLYYAVFPFFVAYCRLKKPTVSWK